MTCETAALVTAALAAAVWAPFAVYLWASRGTGRHTRKDPRP